MSEAPLQWGRDPRAADRRSFNCSATVVIQLQWGRDPRAADSGVGTAVVLRGLVLQWGRDPRAADSDDTLIGLGGARHASMGPRPKGRG